MVVELSYLAGHLPYLPSLQTIFHIQNLPKIQTKIYTYAPSFEPGHEKTCLTSYAHPRNLISTFVVHCLDSVMSLVSVTKISSLMIVSAAEQASLSLTWLETPKAHFLITRLIYISLILLSLYGL